MLVLTRNTNEVIVIQVKGCEPIEITLLSVNRATAKVGIKAPKEVLIDREEIFVKRTVRARSVSKKALIADDKRSG